MASALYRVATCSPVIGPRGINESTGPANRCLNPDGTSGYWVFVDAYLSDAPVTSVQVVGTGSTGGSGSLLDMTPEQAGPVAAAVFGVWAAAWVAKQAIRTLRGSDEKID